MNSTIGEAQPYPFGPPAEISEPRDVAYAYAWLMDRRAFEEIQHLVTDDVVYSNARGEVRGWENLRAGLKALAVYDATYHFIGNHLGRWTGDTYDGSTYCIASHLYRADNQARKYDMGIIYTEHMVRIGRGVKLKHRHVTLTWQQDSAVPERMPTQFNDAIAKLMAEK